jgi:hypothetical protein
MGDGQWILKQLTHMKTSSNITSANSLELNAEHILAAVGLSHRRTRKRRIKEVDMVFGRHDFPFGAWNVRFKVCDELTLDDVATEVGIAQGDGNRFALVACTGKVTATARRYAAYVSANTRFQVMVLDGDDLKLMASNHRRVRPTLAAQTPLVSLLPEVRKSRQRPQ